VVEGGDLDMTQKKGDENMNASKEIQDEMVGVLTAISIVSKRLASRLLDLDNEQEDEQKIRNQRMFLPPNQ
jgi:hypothetical protein